MYLLQFPEKLLHYIFQISSHILLSNIMNFHYLTFISLLWIYYTYIFIFVCVCVCVCARARAQSLSHVWLCGPIGCSPPGCSVLGFSRQEYWSALPFSPPGDLPNPEIKLTPLVSLALPQLAGRFFTISTTHLWFVFICLDAKSCPTHRYIYIPGSGRSPGEGNGNPLQYSCLENSTDGGALWATVHGVTKSRHDWETSLSIYEASLIIR